MLGVVERMRVSLPLPVKRVARIVSDLAVLTAAFFIAYELRFDFTVPADYLEMSWQQLRYVVPLQLAALWAFGVYRHIWRYVSLSDVWPVAAAGFFASIPMVLIRLLPHGERWARVPLSVIIVDSFLAVCAVLMLRVITRLSYEATERARHSGSVGPRKPVLLIGAGQGGMLAARELMRRADAGIDIRGFVDDDPAKTGTTIHGVRVLGTTAQLPTLVGTLDIDHVIITIAKAQRENIQRIVEICEAIPVKARIIPGLYEILGGQVEVSRIRSVEIEDLLGREQVQLDETDIARLITGRVVMVTGAGGSIGSELARQVARFAPARLLLVERAEFALFEIDRELHLQHPELEIDPLVADTGDEKRIRGIFARYRPHVVVHAAAHKHVPMMELQPSESIKNNVLTTRLLGNVAGEFDTESFVLVSTDKAVNPTSVMGASKRVAELVVQDLSQLPYKTRFVGVRFGNVMGSAGSVIPIFRKQIAAGGPVTVTHPDMTRFFMTIPEAAQLVLQAAAIGEGGEIFVLDMGEPVKIVDMAIQMIKLSGLKPNEDIDIVFSGVRPGEKLYEEIDRMGETLSKTKHPKIFNGNLTPYPRTKLREAIQKLELAATKGKDSEVRHLLSELIPEAHLEKGEHVEVELPTIAIVEPQEDAGARIAVRAREEQESPVVEDEGRPAVVETHVVH
ncbi:MAG: nucleoside-diphosphate sugar epimerase/dehydratase [Thermoanaerobaculia bacterium]